MTPPAQTSPRHPADGGGAFFTLAEAEQAAHILLDLVRRVGLRGGVPAGEDALYQLGRPWSPVTVAWRSSRANAFSSWDGRARAQGWRGVLLPGNYH